MDCPAFLQYLMAQADYRDQVAHIEHLPPRPARHADLDRPLAADLACCLEDGGLLPLYTHQARAVNTARDGRNVMVATTSASGKSLCYNIAVFQAMLEAHGG